MSYDPRGSGLFKGAGTKRYKRRRKAKTLPFMHLSDHTRIREEVPDFDPNLEYTDWDLVLMAEKILISDDRPPFEHPAWLDAEAYRRRAPREIYVGDGIPDPAHNSGLYFRSHPQGRKLSTRRQREDGAGFYR